MNQKIPCKLCGLPVTDPVHQSPETPENQFCCNGCKMVYAMIMESEEYRGVSDFTQTKLYKKCVAAGVIPDPEEYHPGSSAGPPAPIPLNSERDTTLSLSGADNMLTWRFSLSNMWCPACAWVIEDALKKTRGVKQAVCNFSSDRGTVHYNPVKTSPEILKKKIEQLGYGAYPLDEAQRKNIGEFVRLSLTFFLTMNIMMFSWAVYSGFFWELSRETIKLLSWPAWVMASIVLTYGGYPVHKKALAGLKAGSPGMEVLISLGSVTAYFYSVFNVFKSGIHLYFDAASMLILLILIGKKLEQSAKNKIAAGLSEFLSLAPEKVKICSSQFPNGRYVSIKQLSKNDVFLATQGEILAADGVILDGSAIIDESSITGEPKPVSAGRHDKVKSGTRISSGSVRIKANKVGADSVLGKMMAIIEGSLSGKTRQSVRFEKLLKLFVPGVISLSVMTFFGSLLLGHSSYEAMTRGLSVMVISCPCALGIAIPLALVAGVSLAGRSGILVRDLEAFESLEGLDTIVFDKTGTLTAGKMDLLEVQVVEGFDRDFVLSLALALETESGHFIATAIKTYCEKFQISPAVITNIEQHSNGVKAIYDNSSVRLGNRDFLGEVDIPTSSAVDDKTSEVMILTKVFLSLNGEYIASMSFGDALRPGTAQLISALREQQISLSLISGDTTGATQSVARSTGIPLDSAHGGLLPHEKATFVSQLRKTRRKVAMVGDGINDAPAMAASDLAVAVHSGLNPGDSVASITLMQEDPRQLLDFFNYARRVNRTVRQNLIFAFVYNLIGIPIAASGLLNPIIAVTAMLCSSLSVTFNTLFLVRQESGRKGS